ncbi:hypothetical protein PFNF135_00008 [Plasmodium falciparum NF135/5.C10]|uniref:Surface antigen n=1 Tax=Plasmodium falciparum NF135/5.C10 TaxID=1036726 RepID=W4IP96_PLAFA|nr:hypothetical protein PFNF135_00008 [Plasmodium falciparum NF135/5.C10]
MKVHYINILLFSFPLNILVYNQRNHKSAKTHTPISRLLCECDLYIPNYENDAQMKSVMDNFNKQTQQRFHEYDERMKTTRQKCREQCDKEIQKIILKDKLEKELMDKFATLQTDIQDDAIPTCVCEKSLEEKVEKGCLRCGYGLGTVAPTVGLIGAVAVNAWKPKALETAIAAALKVNDAMISAAANAAGIQAGVITVIQELEALSVHKLKTGILDSIGNAIPYNNSAKIINAIHEQHGQICNLSSTHTPPICGEFDIKFNIYSSTNHVRDALPSKLGIKAKVEGIVTQAEGAADAAAKSATDNAIAEITTKQTTAINTIFMSKQTAIIASVVAIVVIVLIMIIIYLILRYRRKKKMKKKLQYIKLLKE